MLAVAGGVLGVSLEVLVFLEQRLLLSDEAGVLAVDRIFVCHPGVSRRCGTTGRLPPHGSTLAGTATRGLA